MAVKVANTSLNASTLDILNVIRENASVEYQNLVPEITDAKMIPQVGDVIMGHPSLSNQFISSLVNRIAAVKLKSATFNNPYSRLKKGFLEFGETIEDIFVGIASVREHDVEKAASREFKRTMPDVSTAFYTMNWRVQYPITVQDEDLSTAFLSADGVQSLISTIIQQVYTAAEYDEYLLFKYLIIKAVTQGNLKPVSIGDGLDMATAAKTFRATSNKLTFMTPTYNKQKVRTNTPRERQIIFMDSDFNAAFDVDVLSAAFNMDKADFMGSLYLIDDFSSFDNERFETIRANCDMISEVTEAELAIMANVKSILVDEEWFQVYDNKAKFTEQNVTSGLYWNYTYHVWKTLATSPFANAVVMATTVPALAASYTLGVNDKIESDVATMITVEVNLPGLSVNGGMVKFIQTQAATAAGIAINPYGTIIFPIGASAITLEIDVNGTIYEATTTVSPATAVGADIVFNPKA